MLKQFVKSLPYIRELVSERDLLKEQNEQLRAGQSQCDTSSYKTWVPLNHYYSPFPDLEEIRSKHEKIFCKTDQKITGIDINLDSLSILFEDMKQYYKELPFDSDKKPNLRYFFDNPSYSYSDAIFLYSMIRHLKPARIVEVGSGYSSCVMLDTNELFFNNNIDCSFIEPYPELLLSLLKNTDKINLIQEKLQDVSFDILKNYTRETFFLLTVHMCQKLTAM